MDIQNYMLQVGQAARAASFEIAKASTGAKNLALQAMAKAVRARSAELLAANAADLVQAKQEGLDAAMIDRLTLTAKGVESMAQGLEQVASLPDPVGEITDLKRRGMFEDTLIVWSGEFGRTPMMQTGKGPVGRDHHNSTSLN